MAGLLVPRILSSFAELEGANLSVRERRKHEETAKAGKRSGGGHRPFGFTRIGAPTVPVEADASATQSTASLRGTMYGVAADWNAPGPPRRRPAASGTVRRSEACRARRAWQG